MAQRKESETLWQRLVGAGEERLGQLAEDVLANQKVTEALASALRRAAQTKGKVDRNLQLFLGALNLPTRQDFNRLTSKVEALQGSLVNLNIKLDRLLASLEPKKRPPARRAPKSRADTPAADAGA
ncbi:MAG TPA: hypothetical protein VFD92_01370 [Candidatus Binatia bacterium]|nr:hypothetical protein [Candidatus Binatia bacterium]